MDSEDVSNLSKCGRASFILGAWFADGCLQVTRMAQSFSRSGLRVGGVQEEKPASDDE